MHILIINQYYYPDIAATAQICADLAEDLVYAGHQVTVLAGTARYRAAHDGDRALPADSLPLVDEHQGVRILRVPVFNADGNVQQATSLLSRGAGYASFVAAALLRLLRCERPDVVLALSTPPLVAALGLVAKALRGARFVYWVQDLYPELAIALGVMKAGGAAARAFAALSGLLYRQADALVALDDDMAKALLHAGAKPAQIHVIDNWCDGNEVTPCPPAENRLLQHLAWTVPTSTMTIAYAGNLGRGHDFATLAQALPLLREDPVRFLFIGEGPQLPALQAQVATQHLDRVRFLPPQARSVLREVLSAGDVGLVTLAEGLEGLLVPSKVYGMMAAGRPILYVGPGTGRVAELMHGGSGANGLSSAIGESVRNGDVGGLVAAVRRLAADRERRAQLGAQARALFLQRYERRLATARHEELLTSVVHHARHHTNREDQGARR